MCVISLTEDTHSTDRAHTLNTVSFVVISTCAVPLTRATVLTHSVGATASVVLDNN